MKKECMKKMGDMMDETLKEFFIMIEHEYKIPKNTLWKKWNDGDGSDDDDNKVPIPLKKDTKKSDYQTFFSIQRNRMVKEDPNITFGEISKQVSSMWKKLTPEEKMRYSDIPKTPTQTFDDLHKEYMKISTTDLKNLCKEKGIDSKFRKKEDMANALVDIERKKHSSSSISLKQEDITKGRSKLELCAEDKDDEEEDFYFQDDGSVSSQESRAYDEDDAGILISDEDNDIFSDDD